MPNLEEDMPLGIVVLLPIGPLKPLDSCGFTHFYQHASSIDSGQMPFRHMRPLWNVFKMSETKTLLILSALLSVEATYITCTDFL